ncbi:MAG: hypothetical protein PHD02_00275 [Bacilli bacterium]|nr:hypothetical protein [Bacilli bacterium]
MGKVIDISSFKNYGLDEKLFASKINKIIAEDDIKKQYSLIFDYICDYIDSDMKIHNYCDFQNGRCIANRLGKSVHIENGCCYQFRVGLCKHLINGTCTNKNIACKIFMCSYLEKQKIKYDLDEIFPIKLFFNRKQISVLKRGFFKPKDEIINLLLKYKTK